MSIKKSEFWKKNPKVRKKVIFFTYALLLTAMIPLFCGGQVDYIVVFIFLFTVTGLIEMIIDHALPFHLTLMLVFIVGAIGYNQFSWSVWTVFACASAHPLTGMFVFKVCNSEVVATTSSTPQVAPMAVPVQVIDPGSAGK